MGVDKWWMLLFLFFGFVGHAQPYYFRHYNTENGLPDPAVYSIIQDGDGFMWFGTKEGIARFDGYRFKSYDPNPATEASFPKIAMSFALDSSGGLWAGTERSLMHYDRLHDCFTPLFDSLHQVWVVKTDDEGRLWFIADTLLYCYGIRHGDLRCYSGGNFPHAIALAVCSGLVWFASPDGRLHRLDPRTGALSSYDLYAHSAPAAFKWISVIEDDGAGGLFIGCYSGLKHLDQLSGTYADIGLPGSGQASPHTLSIANAGNGRFWFGTESGVYVYDLAFRHFVRLTASPSDPYSLSYNEAWTIYRDREGGIWLGTFLGGLDYCPLRMRPLFRKYFAGSATAALSGTRIGDVCEDTLGRIWAATEDGGLDRIDPLNDRIDFFLADGRPGSISYHDVKTLLSVGDQLWAGTRMHGLDVLDVRSGKVVRHYSAGAGKDRLKSDFITCLLHHSNGSIYVGTDQSVFRFDPHRDAFPLAPLAPPGASITCLLEDHTGGLWVGTHGKGVFFIDSGERSRRSLVHRPDDVNSLSNDVVNTMAEDRQRVVWFGMEGSGICRLSADRRQIRRIGMAQGLPSNYVFKFLSDARGNIWASTSKGLVVLDSGGRVLTVYTRDNGLLTEEFNYNAGQKASDGMFYFGATKGLIAFHPDSITTPMPAPPVYITGVQVNNRELAVTGGGPLKQSLLSTHRITLNHSQTAVSIDFAALSYLLPGHTGYWYRLEGLDQEWTFLPANRRVYFTGLKPGDYTFKVTAAEAPLAGAPTREPSGAQMAVLEIEILPPLWFTWWALSGYVIALLGLCWYGWKGYDQRQRLRKEKEGYAARILLFTHMAHEIRTPLTLIAGPLEILQDAAGHLEAVEPELKAMQANTARLLQLVDQLLDLQKVEAHGFRLEFTMVNIGLLIREVWAAFEPAAVAKGLAVELQLSDRHLFIRADREALYKILSNLLSNAIKYADKRLRVRLRERNGDEKNVIIEVSNDGRIIPMEMKDKIFEPFERLRAEGFQRGTGLGLTLARSLTVLHGGQLYLEPDTEGLNTLVLVLTL